MWEELGISSGTGIIVFVALYFVIKWAVKNGINESMLSKSILIKDANETNDEGDL
ncbi:DUF6019 family protein [Clostridium sp.]|uniref:DUF6019 family protein n=1 Tax=Clostridium sp. TaxID=1506 RepID=UPI0032180E0C